MHEWEPSKRILQLVENKGLTLDNLPLMAPKRNGSTLSDQIPEYKGHLSSRVYNLLGQYVRYYAHGKTWGQFRNELRKGMDGDLIQVRGLGVKAMAELQRVILGQ